jgi:ribonuclease HI
MNFDIYTDGSADLKSKLGGWAFVIITDGLRTGMISESGHVSDTTNNRIELSAILMGLARVGLLYKKGDSIKVYTDSEWCVNCINKCWLCTANSDLLELIREAANKLKAEIHIIKEASYLGQTNLKIVHIMANREREYAV